MKRFSVICLSALLTLGALPMSGVLAEEMKIVSVSSLLMESDTESDTVSEGMNVVRGIGYM